MATIIGEEINPLLQKQLDTRQSTQGSGVLSLRTQDELVSLNANNSWVKLASGVSISSNRLIQSKLNFYSEGMDLAKQNILFGGTARYNGGVTTQKSGNESYEFGEFGFVPMPGINDVTVKSLNRGAIKKATISITAHNKQQFEIINLLYLHLGYTVMLEWGNAFFLDNSSKLQKVGNTLIENMFFSKTKNGSYADILPFLNSYREKYHFNYDGMLGKISNYSWSFKKDGTYDIELNLVSMGDVVESLKTNISIDKSLSSFLEEFNTNQETTGSPPAIESNKNESLLSSYLFLYQFIDSEDTKNNTTRSNITINNGDKVGVFLNNGGSNLTVNSKTYKFYKHDPLTDGISKSDDGVKTFNSINPERDALDELYNRYTSYSTSGNKTPKNEYKTQGDFFIYADKDPFVETITTPVVSMEENPSTSTTTATIANPINNDPPNVAIKINATTPQYYIKMDYVLKFLKNKIIPNIKSTPSVPLVDLITNPSFNIMYRIGDIHVSLDPRVCIVRNDGFRELDVNGNIVTSKAYPELDAWGDSSNKNKAYLNNIYLNFTFIINCMESSQDEKGNSNLFQFLSSICDGLNKALGGVNNLEPTIDEPSNSIRIIDSTPIPNTTTKSSGDNIILFGYEGNTKSNFVRKLDIKTTIPPQMATMVSVGATAGGYVKGVESTAFAKWNKGINDRFKVDYVPPNMSSSIDSEKEVEENYIENFVQNDANAYGLDAIAEPRTFTDSVITKNISTVTEYYRYVFSQNKNSGGSIGFIPFKISFTMDGISGFKIYNKIKLNLKFLSKDYQNFLNFIITEINNKIADQDWETEISAILHPETNIISPVIKRAKQLVNVARTPPTPVGIPGAAPLIGGNSATSWWYYSSWQQGPGGGAELWKIIKGRQDKFSQISRAAIADNWPAGANSVGNPKYTSSDGVNWGNAKQLYDTDPKRLATAFAEVQIRLFTEEKYTQGNALILTPNAERTGFKFSEMKAAFEKVISENPNPDLPFDVIVAIGYAENGLNTDTEASNNFQTMFQMGQYFYGRPSEFLPIINKYKKGSPTFKNYSGFPGPGIYQGYANTFTEFYNYFKEVYSFMGKNVTQFKSLSGYPN